MQISAFHVSQYGAYRRAGGADDTSNRLNPSESSNGIDREDNGAQSLQETSSSEQRELQKLKSRDREVRAHEQAHVAAGGRYVTSGASFQYQRGPDGRLYAVGGEVGIDTAPVRGDPQATVQKAETIRRAALAPADPSAQDRQVAAQAAAMAAQARADLQSESGADRDPSQTRETSQTLQQRIHSSGATDTGEGNDIGNIDLFA